MRHDPAVFARIILGMVVTAVLVGCLAVAVGTHPSSASGSAGAVGPTRSQHAEEEQTCADGVVTISLGNPVTVSGSGATVDGSTVRITSAGVYRLSGDLTDGRIEIDTEGEVYVELAGVDIASDVGPAMYVADAKRVTLTLTAGTTNRLSGGAAETGAAPDAAETGAAPDDAETGAGPDDAETGAAPGDADRSTGGDSATLFTNDTLVINGAGTLVVDSTAAEGISSDDDIIINNGAVRVTAGDDGLNANDDITINGGDVYVLAGDDGLDSNGTVTVHGGKLTSSGGAAAGQGGVDAAGAFTITGGTVLATGGMVAAPGGGSTQSSLYVRSGSVQAAGTLVRVLDEGDEVLGFTPDVEYRTVLFSSDDLAADGAYQVLLGVDSESSVVAGPSPASSFSVADETTRGGRS